MAAGIGVDNGGNGLAVAQELLTLDKYRDLQLDGRLRRYDFGGMTTLAVRDGKEVRKRTKEFMTSLISGTLQRRQVVFPAEDLEIEDHSPPTPTRCATAGSSTPRATTTSSMPNATRCSHASRPASTRSAGDGVPGAGAGRPGVHVTRVSPECALGQTVITLSTSGDSLFRTGRRNRPGIPTGMAPFLRTIPCDGVRGGPSTRAAAGPGCVAAGRCQTSGSTRRFPPGPAAGPEMRARRR